jgi:hypothetical protein
MRYCFRLLASLTFNSTFEIQRIWNSHLKGLALVLGLDNIFRLGRFLIAGFA